MRRFSLSKLKFSISTLTSCSGCVASLMALDVFPQFLERTELIYFPFMTDSEEIVEHDIALVEGCVSNPNDIELLKKIRTNSVKVYALGSCAAFGGILSLSNKKNAEPIANYIEIDGMIPGCPPAEKFLGNLLIRLIENKEITLSEKNLCATCPLRETMNLFRTPKSIDTIYSNPYEFLEKKEDRTCFLNRGILCLGPITRDGCEQKCIEKGIPCEGCMGPISKDFTSNVVNFLGLFEVSEKFKKYKGIYYRFSKPQLEK
ncbi:MAG: putative F420-non-reducing hydrogenase vhu subunit G [Promethearchaeota archaeon]|nr:MAG: putative F420-non-reducing hydrogenase vhu subunit G [Candidatus Lokiarchaeota archaeon]